MKEEQDFYQSLNQVHERVEPPGVSQLVRQDCVEMLGSSGSQPASRHEDHWPEHSAETRLADTGVNPDGGDVPELQSTGQSARPLLDVFWSRNTFPAKTANTPRAQPQD